MAAPQLPRARSRKEKGERRVLDQPVHLVEQGGNLLHFINDDQVVPPIGKPFSQQRGARRGR